MATLRLLEMARSHPSPLKFYHASSAEIFGAASASPQTETTRAAAAEPVWLRQSVGNPNWHGCIDNGLDCLFAMAFFTTMSHRAVGKIS